MENMTVGLYLKKKKGTLMMGGWGKIKGKIEAVRKTRVKCTNIWENLQ